jgi:hypothetical protein
MSATLANQLPVSASLLRARAVFDGMARRIDLLVMLGAEEGLSEGGRQVFHGFLRTLNEDCDGIVFNLERTLAVMDRIIDHLKSEGCTADCGAKVH